MPIRRPNRPRSSAGTPPQRRVLGRASAAVAVLVGALALTTPGTAVAGSSGRLAAGGNETCVMVSDGSVRCWGSNSAGQLGTGSLVLPYSPVPVVVPGLSGVTELAVGSDRVCARMTNATARCWGLNDLGQIGDGTTTNRAAPVFVRNVDGSPLTGVAQIAPGRAHTCARMSNGTARCWGANFSGQLGDGTTTNRPYPVFVRTSTGAPLTGVASIESTGGSTCARMTDGTARCWGDNGNGQLGDGTTTNRLRPVFVRTTSGSPLTGVTQVSTGTIHACARLSNGTARCWGYNNGGQVGDGTRTFRFRAVPVLASGSAQLGGVAQINAGSFHTCARMTNGTVRCWGANGFGQLGDATSTERLVPVFARTSSGSPVTGVTTVSGGRDHTCARLTNGTLRCWGDNTSGQVGDGTTTNRSTAATVVGGGPLAGAG